MEDVLKRAFDANLRYWETLNRAASEYVQTMTKVWKDAPISWTPGTTSSKKEAATAARPEEAPFTPALLLEGPAGSTARAVVMVRNDLDREAEAPIVPSLFAGPDGATHDLDVRADPPRVTVAPGGQVAVTLSVPVTSDLHDGVGYRGEVNVPGLSDRGVPVVVRRRGTAGSSKETTDESAPAKKPPTKKAAATKTTTAKKASTKKAPTKKAAAKKASTKKAAAKKASTKKAAAKSSKSTSKAKKRSSGSKKKTSG